MPPRPIEDEAVYRLDLRLPAAEDVLEHAGGVAGRILGDGPDEIQDCRLIKPLPLLFSDGDALLDNQLDDRRKMRGEDDPVLLPGEGGDGVYDGVREELHPLLTPEVRRKLRKKALLGEPGPDEPLQILADPGLKDGLSPPLQLDPPVPGEDDADGGDGFVDWIIGEVEPLPVSHPVHQEDEPGVREPPRQEARFPDLLRDGRERIGLDGDDDNLGDKIRLSEFAEAREGVGEADREGAIFFGEGDLQAPLSDRLDVAGPSQEGDLLDGGASASLRPLRPAFIFRSRFGPS